MHAEDSEELTEFEGPLTAEWIEELTKRGIGVKRNILREAARVFLRYRQLGGRAY